MKDLGTEAIKRLKQQKNMNAVIDLSSLMSGPASAGEIRKCIEKYFDLADSPVMGTE